MMRFAFTYDGSQEHPFKDGFVLVWAKDWIQAIERYRRAYPVAVMEDSVSPNANIRCAHMLQVKDLKDLGNCHRVIGNSHE